MTTHSLDTLTLDQWTPEDLRTIGQEEALNAKLRRQGRREAARDREAARRARVERKQSQRWN